MEHWKSVTDHPGYEVSCLGRVRTWLERPSRVNVGFRRSRSLPILLDRPYLLKLGQSGKYPSVCFAGASHAVHRLVLLAFRGPADGLQCRHMNGIRSDPRLANLQWGTAKENRADTIRHAVERAEKCPAVSD